MARSPPIFIIKGEKNAGKTRLCHELAKGLASEGVRVAGAISPAQWDDQGNKVGIFVEEVVTGERRLMARKRSGDESETEGILLTPNWAFDTMVLEWGNEIFEKLKVDEKKMDVLLVDEVGPVELERERGWIQALKRLDEGQFNRAVVVVRAEHVEKACQRWPHAEVIHVDSDKTEAAGQLLDLLLEKTTSQ